MAVSNPDLIFRKGDVEYMRLCLDVSVYWHGSLFDHAAGVEGFYRRALEVIGKKLRFYATHEMSHAQPLAADTLELLPSWLANPDRTQDVFTLNLEGNSLPDMPSDTAIDFWAVEEDRAGVIRLILPVDFIANGADDLRALAQTLVGDMRFHSGHGGYAINWDHKGEFAAAARRTMGVLSRRYPAIDLPDSNITLMSIATGMKRINWLTLVGNALLEQLGGAADLAASLAQPGIRVDSLPGGVLITAGAQPSVGDVNRREDLDAYRAVGRAVAPVRTRDHVGFLADQSFDVDDDLTEEWLAYFDR